MSIYSTFASHSRGDSVYSGSPPFSISTDLLSVTGSCSLPLPVGAGSWIARICQPWRRSPSRSWLPIVEDPGYLRHLISTSRRSC